MRTPSFPRPPKRILFIDLYSSLANAFSYWQAQEIGNATATYFDDIMQALGHIQQLSGSLTSIRVMNGETGWPTGNFIAQSTDEINTDPS